MTPLGVLFAVQAIDAEQYRAGVVFALLDQVLHPARDGCPEALPLPHLVDLIGEHCPVLWDLPDVQFRPAIRRRVEDVRRQCFARLLNDPHQTERTLIALEPLPLQCLRDFRRDLNALARVFEIPRNAAGLTLDDDS